MKCKIITVIDDSGKGRTLHGVRGLKSWLALNGAVVLGRTLHGVRGLKYTTHSLRYHKPRRTLHGVRGLKLKSNGQSSINCQSHSSWSAWIEMFPSDQLHTKWQRRTLHGVRGLKSLRPLETIPPICRTLHGVRGLK